MSEFQEGDVIVFQGAENVSEREHGWEVGMLGTVVERCDDAPDWWIIENDESNRLPVKESEIEHLHLEGVS